MFVNVSVGGTLTHFAAPPVLMVARPWGWNSLFMVDHFGWRAIVASRSRRSAYLLFFVSGAREPARAAGRCRRADQDDASARRRVPPFPRGSRSRTSLFIGLDGAQRALTRRSSSAGSSSSSASTRRRRRTRRSIDFKTPLLVGFFLAGLVIHGGLQGWWIAPLLGRLSRAPLFFGAIALTAFNDNALITYLATLVPGLGANLKVAVVAGAVTGGGLTVIANAPNPAGQALLSRFFDGAIQPLMLLSARPSRRSSRFWPSHCCNSQSTGSVLDCLLVDRSVSRVDQWVLPPDKSRRGRRVPPARNPGRRPVPIRRPGRDRDDRRAHRQSRPRREGYCLPVLRIKDEILRQLLEEHLEELRTSALAAIHESGTLEVKLRGYIAAILAFFDKHRDFIDHCQLELTPDVRRKVRTVLSQCYKDQVDAWDKVLRRAVSAGTVVAASVDGAASNIVSLARGLALHRLAGWPAGPIDPIATRAGRLLWKGLAGR